MDGLAYMIIFFMTGVWLLLWLIYQELRGQSDRANRSDR